MAVDFIPAAFCQVTGRPVSRVASGVLAVLLVFAAEVSANGADIYGAQRAVYRGMERGGQGICPQTRTVPQAPEDFAGKNNPLPPTDNDISAGESLFQLQAEPAACKVCHGSSGNGLGMMAQGPTALPRNFTCAETMRGISDGQLFWVIKNGSGGTGMPPYKFLSDKQIWQLILYLRKFSG